MTHEWFPETSWTLLDKACEPCDEGIRARADFTQRYYRPVREFLRVLVHDPEEVKELSQEFFAKVSEPAAFLEHANRERGRFRDFLKASLRNLAIDHMRRLHRNQLASFPDEANGCEWEAFDAAKIGAADAAFHREWVELKLAEALAQVRSICEKKKQTVHLALFEARYLSDADAEPSWEELGAPYGLDERAARERATTVVRHFRLVLRHMLADEVPGLCSAQVTRAGIDDEIRALLGPLRQYNAL